MKVISVSHMRAAATLSTLAPSCGYITYCGYTVCNITAQSPAGLYVTTPMCFDPNRALYYNTSSSKANITLQSLQRAELQGNLKLEQPTMGFIWTAGRPQCCSLCNYKNTIKPLRKKQLAHFLDLPIKVIKATSQLTLLLLCRFLKLHAERGSKALKESRTWKKHKETGEQSDHKNHLMT